MRNYVLVLMFSMILMGFAVIAHADEPVNNDLPVYSSSGFEIEKFELNYRGNVYKFALSTLDASEFIVELGCRLDTGKVDIVFTLDSSGSMGDDIAQVRAALDGLAARLHALNYQYRFGLVTQSGQPNVADFDPITPGYQMTGSYPTFRIRLFNVGATGGAPGGNEWAWPALWEGLTKYDWRSDALKIIFISTDEPSCCMDQPGCHTGPCSVYVDNTAHPYPRWANPYMKVMAEGFIVYSVTASPLVGGGGGCSIAFWDTMYHRIARNSGGEWFNTSVPWTTVFSHVIPVIDSTHVINLCVKNNSGVQYDSMSYAVIELGDSMSLLAGDSLQKFFPWPAGAVHCFGWRIHSARGYEGRENCFNIYLYATEHGTGIIHTDTVRGCIFMPDCSCPGPEASIVCPPETTGYAMRYSACPRQQIIIRLEDDDTTVDSTSIKLRVSSTYGSFTYTIDSTQLEWHDPYVVFTPDTDWVHLTPVSYSLVSATDANGCFNVNTVSDRFGLDLMAPEVFDTNPPDGYEFTSPPVNIIFRFIDYPSGVRIDSSLYITVNGTLRYYLRDPHIRFTPPDMLILMGMWHEFAGDAETMVVCLHLEDKVPPYVVTEDGDSCYFCGPNDTTYCFTYYYNHPMDARILRPHMGDVISCDPIEIVFRFMDEDGDVPDTSTLVVRLRRNSVDTFDYTSGDLGVSMNLVDDSTVIVTIPSDSFSSGDFIVAELLYGEDMMGRLIDTSGLHIRTSFRVDYDPPVGYSMVPAPGSLSLTFPYTAEITLFDSVSGVDTSLINVVVNDTITVRWTGDFDASGAFRLRAELDPSVCYGADTLCDIRVCVDVGDKPDLCEPNDTTICWVFQWLHGRPWVHIMTPHPESYFACRDSGIVVGLHGGAAPVDSNSITLTIRHGGTVDFYGIVHERLFVDVVGSETLLVFDPPYGYWVEGDTYTVSIPTFADMSGDSARGLPITWWFIPDFTPPVVSGFVPADDSLMPTPSPTIRFRAVDALSGVDSSGIYVTIHDWMGFFHYDDTFGVDNELVSWDGEHFVLTLPDSSFTFEDGDTVEVCIHVPDRTIDCGPNVYEECHRFIMHLTPPVARVVEPTDGQITACDDQCIKIYVVDDDGAVDFGSAVLEVNGVTYDFSSAEVSSSGDTLIFCPPSGSPWVNNQLVTVTLRSISDEYGNALSSPITWSFRVDLEPPTLDSLIPVCGDTAFTVSPRISFFSTDNLAGVDRDRSYIVLDGDTFYFTHPAFSISGGHYVFSCLEAGLRWRDGDIMHMCIHIADGVDLCGPNAVDSCCDIRIVPRGPVPSGFNPGNLVYSSCDPEDIYFVLEDEDSVIISTLEFWVTRSSDLSDTVVLHYGDAEVSVDASAAPFRYGITYTPSSPFVDGETVWVCITRAEDSWTNPLAAPRPRCWHFFIDRSGPYVTSSVPAAGVEVATRTPYVLVNLSDDGAGLDSTSVVIEVNGTAYSAVVTDTGFYWDPRAHGLLFTGGDTIRVCVRANDLATLCGANSLDSCWHFAIEAGGPIATPVEPLESTYTSCDSDSVRIRVADHNGLDLATMHLTIGGVRVGASDPLFSYDAAESVISYDISSFPDGPITVDLTGMDDMLGNPLETPLHYVFFIDRTPPVAWGMAPVGEVLEVAPLISVGVDDSVAGLNLDSLSLTVDGVPYTLSHAALSYDGATHTLRFDPSIAGVFWVGGDTVQVCLHAADLSDDYCSANAIDTCWRFWVQPGGPSVVFDHPGNHGYTACNPDSIRITIADTNGIIRDSTEVVVGLSSGPTTVPFTSPLPGFIIGEASYLDSLVFYYRPPTLRNGDTLVVVVTKAYDSLYNPISSAVAETFVVDFEPPRIIWTTPAEGETVVTRSPTICIRVIDTIAGVDPATILIIAGEDTFDASSPGVAINRYGDTLRFCVNVGSSGIVWPGDTMITVYAIAGDSVRADGCGPNTDDTTWSFYIMPEGPMTHLIYPADSIFDSCDDDSVVFWLVDRQGDAIDLSTIRIRFESSVRGTSEVDLSSPQLSYVNDTFLVFRPDPPFMDGEHVRICVISATDALGHELFNVTCVDFVVDVGAPYVAPVWPAENDSVHTLTPLIRVIVMDTVSGLNYDSLVVTIDGTDYTLESSALYFVGDTLVFDPESVGVSWHGCDRIEVTVRAEDVPTLSAGGLTFCPPNDTVVSWVFWIACESPLADLVFPANNPTACRNKDIKIWLRDEDGVVTSSIRLTVNGEPYTVDGSQVRYEDDILYFTPSEAFAHGETVEVCVTYAEDNLGNVLDTTCWSFVVDAVAPVARRIEPHFDLTSSRQQEFYVLVDDDFSGVDSIRVWIRNGVRSDYEEYTEGDYEWLDTLNGGVILFSPARVGIEWEPNDSACMRIWAIDRATDLSDSCIDNVLDTSICFFVEQIAGCRVFPNPFTPNNDGINDMAVFTYEKMYTKDCEIHIYDIHGVEVWSKSIAALTDPFDYSIRSWDGRDKNGNPLPQGVYMWVIKQQGGEVICTGTVVIAR